MCRFACRLDTMQDLWEESRKEELSRLGWPVDV